MKEKMKVWLKENWFKAGVLAILITFITGLFYWFGYKNPSIIRKCQLLSIDKTTNINGDRIDAVYFFEKCLKENGLR
jgi:hypothetical protein